MNDILNNPEILAVIQARESADYVLRHAVDRLMTSKSWSEMTPNEREACVRRVVGQTEALTELHQMLDAIGCPFRAIAWTEVDPNDKVALEAQALVKALGGLVSKNGVLVSISTDEDLF